MTTPACTSCLSRLAKRCCGFVIALILCVVLLPLGVMIALLIKLSSQGPVFYLSRRLGKDRRPIKVIKFRTMTLDADRNLEQLLSESPALTMEWREKRKLDSDPRITRVGKLLRRSSLDELPQLFNVLMGDMALVGPRPIVEEEIEKYGRHADLLFSVTPGITGLWQVSGRSELPYRKRVALDVYYITHWSFWLDTIIFLKTFREVFIQRGAK